ncbi:MAG: hypothetical protein ACYDB7_08555 [Mycobacteriales bacterium]
MVGVPDGRPPEVGGVRWTERIGSSRAWRGQSAGQGVVGRVLVQRESGGSGPEPLLDRLVLAQVAGCAPVLLVHRMLDGSVVVVSQEVRGRPLSEVAGAGGRPMLLLAADLCAAVARAHDAGLVHGHLDARDALVTADGRVVLTGLRVAGLVSGPSSGEGVQEGWRPTDLRRCALPDPSPQQDVATLRTLIGSLTGPDQVSTLRLASASSTRGAAVLARALTEAAGGGGDGEADWERPWAQPGPRSAGPRSAGPRSAGPRSAHSRPSPARGWRVAVFVMVGLAGAAGFGWASARLQPLSAGPAPPSAVAVSAPPRVGPVEAPVVAPDWAAVLGDLDRARAAAFAAQGPLAAADLPGSPAYRQDASTLAALEQAHEAARGLRFVLRSVRPLTVGGEAVELAVSDLLPPYELVARVSGAVVSREPGRGARAWVIRLVRTLAGWRIAEVVAGGG